MAWVKPKPGATADGGGAGRLLPRQIATYKIPRYWKFVDEFPMTVTGKVQKYKMREMAVAELETRSAAG